MGLWLSGPIIGRTIQHDRLCLRLPFQHRLQGSQLLAGVLGAVGSISALERLGQIEPGLRVKLPLEVEIVLQLQEALRQPVGCRGGSRGQAGEAVGASQPGSHPAQLGDAREELRLRHVALGRPPQQVDGDILQQYM